MINRNIHTNNSAEAVFRQIKDTILKRVRLFNPVQLVEFFVTKFTSFYKKKLLEYVTDARTFKRIIDPNLKIHEVTGNFCVIKKGEDLTIYDVEKGVCECKHGINGASCSHSIFLSASNFMVPNEEGNHIREVKIKLYYIAKGDQLERPEKFASIHSIGQELPTSQNINFDESLNIETHNEAPPDVDFDEFSPVMNQDDNISGSGFGDEDDEDLKTRLNKVTDNLVSKFDDKEIKKACKTFVNFMEKNLKKPQGMAKIIDALKNIDNKSTRKKIRVQRSSISRRVCGRTTTSSIGSGRYRSNSFLRTRNVSARARPHSLSSAIRENHQNSGKF